MVCGVLERFYNATVEDGVVMVPSKPAEHAKPSASCRCRMVMLCQSRFRTTVPGPVGVGCWRRRSPCMSGCLSGGNSQSLWTYAVSSPKVYSASNDNGKQGLSYIKYTWNSTKWKNFGKKNSHQWMVCFSRAWIVCKLIPSYLVHEGDIFAYARKNLQNFPD